jgi:general secretion pathway protein K
MMPILYVLWGVGLLTMIAVSMLSAGNVSYALSHTAFETAQDQAAAEAGVVRAVLGLLDPRPERRWRVDGAKKEFLWGDVTMRIAIQDELGRIDLNQADQGLLTGLVRSAGLNTTDASGIVDKILDWRDANPGRRLNGAKDRDYRDAGIHQGPRNGPFQSVDELQLVMGMTKELYRRVEPALTVYSGHQFFDPQFAPREALLALPTMTADAVANIIAARTSQALGAGVIPTAIPLGGRAFTIRTQIPGSAGVAVNETVVRLTDDTRQPFWVLSWKSRSKPQAGASVSRS